MFEEEESCYIDMTRNCGGARNYNSFLADGLCISAALFMVNHALSGENLG
jgi:hypothetical protein